MARRDPHWRSFEGDNAEEGAGAEPESRRYRARVGSIIVLAVLGIVLLSVLLVTDSDRTSDARRQESIRMVREGCGDLRARSFRVMIGPTDWRGSYTMELAADWVRRCQLGGR